MVHERSLESMGEPAGRSRLRVAVLECDSPLPAIRERYGNYGDIFQNLLERGKSKESLGDKPGMVVSKWDVAGQQAYPRLEDVDAILLTEASG